MTLLTTILSFLGVSIASKMMYDDESHRAGTYVIFRWEDGATISRSIKSPNNFLYIDGNYNTHMIFAVVPPGQIYWAATHSCTTIRITDAICYNHLCIHVGRIKWLAEEYLEGAYISYLETEALSRPLCEYAPSKVDKYEQTVYESNQMKKSLFLLNNNEFLETIEAIK